MASEDMDSRDLRIGSILNDYLDRQQRGEPVNEQELLDAHPDLADELRSHFETFRQVVPMTSRGGQAAGPTASLPHDALPGYEILDELHRGGQGVVYRALQIATRRNVAVKVMREGPFASWRDRARFEREVQVLGALKHPSIVAIHDSGIAANCHYFVMDYIAGSPLDAWLTSHAPSVPQILQLFVRICDAVNAAHVKGIIHRDLKPGNIRINEENQPHILDFGLAKVTSGGDQERSPADMTMAGQFVGSLPWTSPEQAQGSLDQVDTRTDVYALGVILYQMLSGLFPYQVVGPMRDVLNRIVSEEPAPLRPKVDRDLEAIVLKCLRKEPHLRYQTAGELGQDIERYLRGEPVAARGDSGLYVLRKTLRRYRVPVAVACAFAVLIAVSLLGSVSLWRQAVVERDRAVAAEREQNRQRSRADTKAVEADQARRIAETERARVQEQAEQLRRTTYFNRIALAQNACEQKYLTRAQRLLDACPLDLRGWEWHFLARLARQPTLLDVQADPQCVAATATTPDGERVITGGSDGTIRIFNAMTGALIAEWKGHASQVNTLACSPDGKWIASGGRDRSLRLWDAHAGTARILEQDRQYIYCLAFSPDSTCLVAGGQGRTLAFWRIPDGQWMRTTPAGEGEVSCCAFSADGKHVASGEFLGAAAQAGITVWNAATAEKVRTIAAHPAGILCLAIHPDGKRIASGSSIAPGSKDADGTLKVFDLTSGEQLLSLAGHDGSVDGLAFSPDGTLLASAGSPRVRTFGMEADRTLKLWNATDGTEVVTFSAHPGGGRTVAWAPDGNRLYSGGMDGRLKAWPRTPPAEARVLQEHAGPAPRIAFSPDGTRLVCSTEQKQGDRPDAAATSVLTIRDVATGDSLLTLTGQAGTAFALAWSRDGKYIASAGSDRTIRMWYAENGQQAFAFAGQAGIGRNVAFSPESTLLAAAAGTVATLWDTADGSEYCQLQHADELRTVAFSPDTHWLATCDQSGNVRLWDRDAGNEMPSISTGGESIGLWFGPDSKTMATAHVDGNVRLWNVDTGKRVAELVGLPHSLQWIDFSPDGQRIAVAGIDTLLKIWDVGSASEVFSIRAHDGPLTCACFSPDGKRIATTGQDGLIKIWDADPRPTPHTNAQ